MPKNKKRPGNRLSALLIMVIVLLPSIGFAGTYWVSPTGIATWANCKGATPLSGTAACSLATANANVAPGDTVNLRGGTYGTPIAPAQSGTKDNRIIYQRYANETPTFTGSFFAINLQNRDYIKVDGITASNVHMFYFIGYGSDYNEITNCTFNITTGVYYSSALITRWNSSYTASAPSTHNWIHGNTFARYGRITNCDDAGTIRIGADGQDTSYYNTVENNVFFYGGHDGFDLGTKYNVIRNNIFHNEEAYYVNSGGCVNDPISGFFGNRNLIVTDYGTNNAQYNLIEGNRLGHAGTPPDDDGAMGIENAGAYHIIRYNYIFGNGAAGYYSKSQGIGPNQLRLYNNTIYSNGFGDASINTIFKGSVVISCTSTSTPANQIIKNNIIYGNFSDSWKTIGPDCSSQIHFTNNYTSNPSFVNPNMEDKTSLTLPDLRIQNGSGAIDGGTHLTTANGSGNNSTTLVVHDALYFQDGTWGSDLVRANGTMHPDWIAIGTVSNVVQISSINYETNTITLASPKTWSNGASIWLYKKSNGAIVLHGSAPDYGAHEHMGGVNTITKGEGPNTITIGGGSLTLSW